MRFGKLTCLNGMWLGDWAPCIFANIKFGKPLVDGIFQCDPWMVNGFRKTCRRVLAANALLILSLQFDIGRNGVCESWNSQWKQWTYLRRLVYLLFTRVSELHLDQCASVWMAIWLAWNSQFGFVSTPRSNGINSGDRPAYGPRKTRFWS